MHLDNINCYQPEISRKQPMGDQEGAGWSP